jgi:glycosyltransferase involved in cell wall biosynthesis
VFVAIEATRLANEELAKRNAPWRAHLTLAGNFASEEEKGRVLAAMEKANEATDGCGGKVGKWEGTKAAGNEGACVELAGFLDSGQKKTALEEADCLVFPTFYEGETQGLVLLEAMSAGLPVITTSWRGVAEALPVGYEYVVEPQNVQEMAQAIEDVCKGDGVSHSLRELFQKKYTVERHAAKLADAMVVG